MRHACRRQLAAAGGEAWFGREPAWRHGTGPLPAREPNEPRAPALRTAIVVLSWNAADEVLACLDALADCRRDGLGVVLVDNCSADGTEARVRARHPWVEVLQSGANLGFAGGNDVGLRWALAHGAQYVLLLNADARIDRAALEQLTDHLDRSPRVAAVQPLLVRFDGATVDSAGHRLTARGSPLETGAGAPVADVTPTPRPIFGACAAAVLLRSEALRAIGLLDEGLFVLFEDVDLMFRLRGAGWDVHLLPSARVRHRRGISGARTRWPRGAAGWRRQFWLWRNHVALALRYTPAGRLALGLPRLLARALGALLLAVVLRERALPLWRRFASLRRDSRRALRAHGVDRFFGAGSGAGAR
jgi:GT2 family glycosyltransferase